MQYCSLLRVHQCEHKALFPGPVQLSIAFNTEVERGPGIFPDMGDVRIEPMVEPVPLNMGTLGLRTGRK